MRCNWSQNSPLPAGSAAVLQITWTGSSMTSRVAAATVVLMLASHAALAATPVPAQAQSSAQAAADEIRDIRGPKPVGSNWTIPLMVLAGLLTGAAAYGSWFWNRRRARVPQSPSEIAIERLLAASSLIETQDGRSFSIEVSASVRDFIEQQFQLRAAHRTTDEFLHDLIEPSHGALREHRANLASFLETCDLAKFGGWNLTAADMEALRDAAMRFVVGSAPTKEASPSNVTKPSADSIASTKLPSTARNSHAAFPST